ncbi:MAG: hypothetical protein BRD44_00070 [Bacteroidetes bacterium QS_7_67_15]|nr:MAG: hypothetical protein BRD44_00070 [Bacteroidetes bacterium QS_7_67_15]
MCRGAACRPGARRRRGTRASRPWRGRPLLRWPGRRGPGERRALRTHRRSASVPPGPGPAA